MYELILVLFFMSGRMETIHFNQMTEQDCRVMLNKIQDKQIKIGVERETVSKVVASCRISQ